MQSHLSLMPAWWTFLFSVRLSASTLQGDGCLCVDFALAFLGNVFLRFFLHLPCGFDAV